MVKLPPFGIYTPVIVFFDKDENIDFENISHHVRRLLKSGVKGLVIHGSNGEATHLFPDEHSQIIDQRRTSQGEDVVTGHHDAK